MLARIADPTLRVYFVWEPVLETDTLAAARKSAATVVDRRVEHYWDEGLRLGHRVGEVLGLPTSEPPDRTSGLAWDVYLVYGAGERWWSGGAFPAPVAWWHQLDAVQVPQAPLLDDGSGLRRAVADALGHHPGG